MMRTTPRSSGGVFSCGSVRYKPIATAKIATAPMMTAIGRAIARRSTDS